MLSVTIRQLVGQRRRFLATATAVFLGVAFLVGTLVFTDTIGRTLDSALADSHAGTDAYVRHTAPVELGYGEARPRLDATLVDQVATVDGVAAVAPRVVGSAQIVTAGGTPVGNPAQAPTFGLNWITAPGLNPYRLAEGRAPEADDEVVVNRYAADAGDLHVGDIVSVTTKSGPRSFTVTGIATLGRGDASAGTTAALFTDATAQALLAEPGLVDGFVAAGDSGIGQGELAARIGAALDGQPDVEVITGAALVREDQKAVGAAFAVFRTLMLLFAVIGLYVAAFMIANTMAITVAQRSREMAMLRAVGASRRQVLASVLGEAGLVGVVASVAGALGGVGVAVGLVALFRAFGVDMPVSGTVVRPASVVTAVAAGTTVTLLSAFLPARRASRIAPVEAVRQLGAPATELSRRRLAAGAALAAIATGLLVWGLVGKALLLAGFGAQLLFVATAVLSPFLARPLARLAGRPAGLVFGVAGALAAGNAVRNPKRTARTASSLMIGVALVALITIFAASAKASLSGQLTDSYRGTHIVDSGAVDSASGLDPGLAATIRSEPGVELVAEARIIPAVVGGRPDPTLGAFDAAAIAQLFDLGSVQGDPGSLGADGLAVAADEATERGWQLGDTVEIAFTGGSAPFEVRAIYDRSEEWVGSTFVDVAALAGRVPDQLDNRLYVATTDPDAVLRHAPDYPSARFLDTAGFADAMGDQVDQMIGIMYVLLTLAVVIALLGIANTLSLSIHERRREIGVLRAVGMSRRQLRWSIRVEAVIIALLGVATGLGLGVLFGWSIVHALADQGFDRVRVPFGPMMTVAAVGVAAGVLASVLPARRASRTEILGALAS